MAEDTDLIKYEKSIEEYAKSKSDIIFSNSGTEHGAIVLSKIFKYHTKIRSFSNSFNEKMTNDKMVIDEIYRFLLNGNTLSVLIEEVPLNNEAFKLIYAFKQVFPDKISIKKTIGSDPFYSIFEKNIHFTTGDDSAYRIEYDTANRKAMCSFNDEDITLMLNESFDEYFSKCNAI